MYLSLIIPTLNAAEQLENLLRVIHSQTRQPDEIVVIDSESDDGTRQILSAWPNVRQILISRQDFDHGGTRDQAIRACRGDVVVLLTQDALPTHERCIENLVAPFEDPTIAAVGGRQIAYPDARPFEKEIRACNYPAENRTWSAGDIKRLGVRAFLISDVFSAYRKDAYEAVGGFDHPLPTNEDMLMAERLLHAGYRLAYRGDAVVYHSHQFSLRQEYARNHLIGQVLKRYEARFDHVSETGTGIELVKNVSLALLKKGHVFEVFCFAANCAARLLGNRMGRLREARRKKHFEQTTTGY